MGARVSIHAPVKSATRFAIAILPNSACFNPRAREERDMMTTLLSNVHG